MTEVCDVGRWKGEKQRCSPSVSLTHDIIESMILSRLPVKDLLRFRVVCKQWEATISDPIFAEIHLLQQHKNPSSQKLIALEYQTGYDGLYVANGLPVAELRNNCIEFVSAIEFGFGRASSILCSCDGLYLKCFPKVADTDPHDKCVLWNPSRRTYRELYCPVPVDIDITTTFQAMYYNPLMKDYKIVIGDQEHYAVYSCRDNKWGDVKEMERFLGEINTSNGVFVNGFIYWVVIDFDDFKCTGIICFDCKDESFKRLDLPNCKNRDDKVFQLTSFGGQLCSLITDRSSRRTEIMKKVSRGDEWMESKEEECLCWYRSEYLDYPLLVCRVSENEILFRDIRSDEKGFYLVYDKSKNTLVEIHDDLPPTIFKLHVYKHVENLLLL